MFARGETRGGTDPAITLAVAAGSELKRAREQAGLSAEQLSERTKLRTQKVLALEKGDYSLLPDGIYLDGVVRAYAHEVGIDPELMVERVRLERRNLLGESGPPPITVADIAAVRSRQAQKDSRPSLFAAWMFPLMVMLAGGVVGMSAMYVAKILFERATPVGHSADIASRSSAPPAEAARVSGTIDRDVLNLNFVERGARRRTEGALVLNVDERGVLTGRFSSEAAESSGRAEARPISTR